jgi:hypothetical protein
VTDEAEATPKVAPEFANVPAEELQKYLDDSGLRPGEDADKWASRNRLEREKLLAKYPPDSKE